MITFVFWNFLSYRLLYFDGCAMCRLVASHNIASCSVVFLFIEYSSTFWITTAPPSSALIINMSVLLESSPQAACFSLDVRLFLVALSSLKMLHWHHYWLLKTVWWLDLGSQWDSVAQPFLGIYVIFVVFLQCHVTFYRSSH